MAAEYRQGQDVWENSSDRQREMARHGGVLEVRNIGKFRVSTYSLSLLPRTPQYVVRASCLGFKASFSPSHAGDSE